MLSSIKFKQTLKSGENGFPFFVLSMPQRGDDKVLRQVAERIREIRKELKITQDVVEEDSGLSVGRIEAGSADLTLTTIVIPCDYFEVSLEEFFRGIGNQYPI